MTKHYENLRYLVAITGKPILVIYNKIEETQSFILLDNFTPSNRGSHIYDNSVYGKNVDNIVLSLQTGFAHNTNAQESHALINKIEEFPLISFVFPDSPDFAYIKVKM